MAYKQLVLALSMIVATSPVWATQQEPVRASVAPAGTPETKYCLRVDPLTGSHMETIQCRTRYDWAMLDVDVDAEWAQNGVRVIA